MKTSSRHMINLTDSPSPVSLYYYLHRYIGMIGMAPRFRGTGKHGETDDLILQTSIQAAIILSV